MNPKELKLHFIIQMVKNQLILPEEVVNEVRFQKPKNYILFHIQINKQAMEIQLAKKRLMII